MADGFHVRAALRDATADLHERVDAVFGSADLITRDGYGKFLQAQAAAHVGVEAALDAGGAGAVLPDWSARRRADLIAADLAALGVAMPVPLRAPEYASVPALLGGVYVLEGSRLGGAMLKRSVPAAFPAAFLSGNGSAAWRNLLQILDKMVADGQQLRDSVEAARATFLVFERSGQQVLKAD